LARSDYLTIAPINKKHLWITYCYHAKQNSGPINQIYRVGMDFFTQQTCA